VEKGGGGEICRPDKSREGRKEVVPESPIQEGRGGESLSVLVGAVRGRRKANPEELHGDEGSTGPRKIKKMKKEETSKSAQKLKKCPPILGSEHIIKQSCKFEW